MSFQPSETETSQRQLYNIFKQLNAPLCLLGGLAVYYIVNKSFQKATGRTYIRSKMSSG
jgi:hypothetical protein